MPIITLTTDFGHRDGYVGAMKGVISRLAPAATLIDIAHDIPRGDIAHAAWVVATSTLEFPQGSIHVVVVDPGVGSGRAGVIAQVAGNEVAAGALGTRAHRTQMYVGPDNGTFAYLPVDKVWRIDTRKLGPVSPTFHGRDIFARVAASIAVQQVVHYGEFAALTGRLPWDPSGTHVVHVDRYGNLITNLRAETPPHAVSIVGRRVPVVKTYSDVRPGELLAYVGSAGTIEIAVRDGRADSHLSVDRGAHVSLEDVGPFR